MFKTSRSNSTSSTGSGSGSYSPPPPSHTTTATVASNTSTTNVLSNGQGYNGYTNGNHSPVATASSTYYPAFPIRNKSRTPSVSSTSTITQPIHNLLQTSNGILLPKRQASTSSVAPSLTTASATASLSHSSPASATISSPTSSTSSSSSVNGTKYTTITTTMNGHSTGGSANPILVLEPTNNSFAIKSLELQDQTPVKIGRQTGVTTAPHPSNGYFDSKVLSRVHAEVWADNGKIFIRDLKSSNGTFLNGRRLCAENVESEPFLLNQNDSLEFGIDILDESGALLHEKVACKIYISRTNGNANKAGGAQDSLAKSRNGSPTGSGPSSLHQSGSTTTVVSSGGSGQSTNIDLIISRLQSELSRSQETNSDLGVLKQGLGELERALVSNGSEDGQVTTKAVTQDNTAAAASTAATAAAAAEYQKLLEQNTQAHAAELAELKRQLDETQSELDAYIQKTRLLEPLVVEDEILRRDLAQSITELTQVKLERDLAKDSMNDMINEHQQAMETLRREQEAAVAVLEEVHKENLERLAREGAIAQELLVAKHQEDLAQALQSVVVPPAPEPVVNVEETLELEKKLSELDAESKTLQSNLQNLTKTLEALETEKATLAKELHNTKNELASTTQSLKVAERQLVEKAKVEENLALMTPTSTTGSSSTKVTQRQNGSLTTTTTTTTHGPYLSKSEFSWAQFVFPLDKKNPRQLNQPSTILMSGGFMLVGIGAYVLWNKSGR
ncbi:hypothetical protein EMPS_10796 [Entomortierella parvispora]|uniref:FHA domain-containing protein n=1 Tax=Entomortierella parvispora TaxID=205924 RepID=A0A9P3HLK8_9FUNG|nr:hypothetical protein EMPS_10796 [Entomortierella parvispora]